MSNNKTNKMKNEQSIEPFSELAMVQPLVTFCTKKLAPLSDYIIDGGRLGSHPNLNNIISGASELLKYPRKLKILIEKDPFVITNRKDVIVSLLILRNSASGAKSEHSDRAENILRKIGLPAFIPKHPKKRSNHEMMHIWRQDPEMLLRTVNHHKMELLNVGKNCPEKGGHHKAESVLKPLGGDEIFKCCIRNAFWSQARWQLPDDFFDFDEKLTRNLDITILTLRFISCSYTFPFAQPISFSSLCRYYYKISGQNNIPETQTHFLHSLK